MGLKRLLVCAAGLVLASCGGSGGSDGPAIEGGVVKGPVSGSTVCVYRLIAGAKGEPIAVSAAPGATGTVSGGCYVTPADGSYNFRLPRGTTGDVLVEATGGTFCSNEEVLTAGACPGGGTPVALGNSVMTSVAGVQSNAGATVFTTPLTTAAVDRARGRGVNASNFSSEFSTLAGQILGPTNAATPSQRPTRANQRFLLDVADFLKNGGNLGGAVSSLAQGTTTFAASPGGTPGGTTAPSGTTPATVASGLVGTYNLVFRVGGGAGCSGTGCTFTDGQQVAVVVHGDNRLELPGGRILSNPYYRSFGGQPNQHEVIWFDAAANLEYGLSDNQGQFNEINVGDMAQVQPAGFGKFLGQLRKPEAPANQVMSALAGTYTNALQYRGEHSRASWTTVVIGADGAITFSGGGTGNPSITVANVTAIESHASVGVVRIKHNLDMDGNPATTTHDFVLHLNADGTLRAIAWDPTSDTTPDDAVGVLLVPQGQQLASLVHTGAAVPTNRAIAGTPDGTLRSYTGSAASLPGMGNAVVLDAMGGENGPSWRIMLMPGTNISANTTYNCRKVNAIDVSIQVTLTAGGFPLSTVAAGRCSIRVTSVTMGGGQITGIAGTFVADLYETGRSNGPVRRVLDGVFNFPAPN